MKSIFSPSIPKVDAGSVGSFDPFTAPLLDSCRGTGNWEEHVNGDDHTVVHTVYEVGHAAYGLMDSYSQIHAITISILCLALGTLLLIANLPVLYALLASSKLRLRYAILALLLLAAAIGGFNCMLRAFSIIMELWNENDCKNYTNQSSYTNRTPWNCLGPVASHYELFSFLLLPITLLVNSTDRLLVIYNPISYFLHPKLYLTVQLSMAGLFQLGFMVYVIIAKFNVPFVNNKCTCYVMMSRRTLFVLLFARMFISTMSILVMLVVLMKFRQVQKTVRVDRRLANFNTRQRGFTQAMLFSCCFTFAFFVLPNVTTYCTKLFEMENADLYNSYLKLISYTSTLDFLVIMLYRQQDISAEVLQRFPFLHSFRILFQPLLKPEVKIIEPNQTNLNA
uniref:Bm9890 n=2 Tax=Brugia malayi TaxID=6279 RepID=A0A0H5S7B0_BRUMA|nr:Bm9890 [Brugia malayi]